MRRVKRAKTAKGRWTDEGGEYGVWWWPSQGTEPREEICVHHVKMPKGTVFTEWQCVAHSKPSAYTR